MITNTSTSAEKPNHTTMPEFTAEKVMGFVVIGLFVTGAVGIDRALEMERGIDVLFCLLGAVASFGAVAYLYLRKQ